MDTKVFIICIGNSDDKLPQEQWSTFIAEILDLMQAQGNILTELFTAPNWHQQSAWFAFELYIHGEWSYEGFFNDIQMLALHFNQDSIAIFEQKDTIFIGPATTESQLAGIRARFLNASSSASELDGSNSSHIQSDRNDNGSIPSPERVES